MQHQNSRQINASVRRKCGKLLHKKHLLAKDDLIIIGLSGGKDSLALTDILAFKQKQLPFSISLKAVHVNALNINYKVDTNYLADFCSERNVEFEVLPISVDLSESDKPVCVRCAQQRRNALFNYASESKANKLALGHHLSDAVETLLLNMLHHSSISAIPVSLDLFGEKLQIIRPLMSLTDSEVDEYSKANNFQLSIKECPFSKHTNRFRIRELLTELENTFPHAERNLFKSMQNIYNEYLPKI